MVYGIVKPCCRRWSFQEHPITLLDGIKMKDIPKKKKIVTHSARGQSRERWKINMAAPLRRAANLFSQLLLLLQFEVVVVVVAGCCCFSYSWRGTLINANTANCCFKVADIVLICAKSLLLCPPSPHISHPLQASDVKLFRSTSIYNLDAKDSRGRGRGRRDEKVLWRSPRLFLFIKNVQLQLPEHLTRKTFHQALLFSPSR